jgi:dihydroorotase-like cyclic amidohydrolase
MVRASAFRSRGRNTPFEGWTLRGGVLATIVAGRAVFVNDALLGRATL